jgi:hypothetical protein
MRKLLILLIGTFALACGNTDNTGTDNAGNDVEKGSGETISPQLESDTSDARLDVDTVSSAGEIDQQQQ